MSCAQQLCPGVLWGQRAACAARAKKAAAGPLGVRKVRRNSRQIIPKCRSLVTSSGRLEHHTPQKVFNTEHRPCPSRSSWSQLTRPHHVRKLSSQAVDLVGPLTLSGQYEVCVCWERRALLTVQAERVEGDGRARAAKGNCSCRVP